VDRRAEKGRGQGDSASRQRPKSGKITARYSGAERAPGRGAADGQDRGQRAFFCKGFGVWFPPVASAPFA